MEAIIGLESDIRSFEAEPIDEAACEALGFAEVIEFIDDDPVEQPEIGRVGDDLRISDLIEQPVEDFPSQDFYPGVALALLSDADDHFEPFLPFLHEIRDEFDGMLEIGVEYHAGIARAEIDAGGRGDFFAEIP